MVAVGFPQKSTFTTITADKVVCPDLDSGAGDLVFSRAGAEVGRFFAGFFRPIGNVRLTTDKELTDASGGALIAGDNVGNIDQLAPVTDPAGIRTNLLDTVSGDMEFNREGSWAYAIRAAYVSMGIDLLLGATKGIQDIGTNELLAGDGSGHIDGLGRIDDALKTPATSHYIASSIAPLISSVQSGDLVEATGVWSTDADDILYIFLGALMGRLQLNATVHIDSIKVFYKTSHANGYVDYARCYRNSMVGVSTVMIGERDANDGSGNTDQAVLTIPVDAAMVADYDYYIEVGLEATQGTVTIYGIEVTYHTT